MPLCDRIATLGVTLDNSLTFRHHVSNLRLFTSTGEYYITSEKCLLKIWLTLAASFIQSCNDYNQLSYS